MDVTSGLLDAATGGLFGGLLRLAPEVLKILDRKFERAHELAMGQQAMEVEKIRGANREREIGMQNEGTQLQALIEAVKGQAQATGNRIVDIINATVRPVVTYFFLALYGATKIAGAVGAHEAGLAVHEAVLAVWAPADMGIFAGILSFWFLNRVFAKS